MDFHHVYIRVRNDLAKKWNELPYFTTDDVISVVLESWLSEWHAPVISAMETKNSAAQWKKEEAKHWMGQLAEK